jgi:uncharacterized membrane protein YfcA
MNLPLIAAAGLLVGTLLGALGAGGSVVTVPILVYVLGEDVATAATTSLLVVGFTAASGAVSHARAGTVRLPTALALSAVASLGSVAGSVLRARVDGRSFLLGFAGLLAVAAAAIWRPPRQSEGGARECVLRPDGPSCAKLGASGLVVGFLTGFFGVGGGFVIVAVLLAVLLFPAREAIGTSLVVVALASAMGLVASLRQAAIDWPVAIPFAVAGAVGASFGRRLTRRVDDRVLRRAFAVILVGLALFLAARNLPRKDVRVTARAESAAATAEVGKRR